MGQKDKQRQEHETGYYKKLTGDIAVAPTRELEEIGQRIRKIREEKGLSLHDLSTLTGFEVELLAEMEENVIQPQLGVAIKLSKALDSAFGRLVSGVGSKLYSVTRKDERSKVARSTSNKGKKQIYSYMSLAPEVKGRHMEAFLVNLEVNTEDDMSKHDGEEFIYVIDGEVSLKIGSDAFILHPGDSCYYLSTTPHLIAAQKAKATILAVIYGK
jgi:quercetin dioxygenase-like cupin family protein/DNA-binding transcriptional regulator YiaG